MTSNPCQAGECGLSEPGPQPNRTARLAPGTYDFCVRIRVTVPPLYAGSMADLLHAIVSATNGKIARVFGLFLQLRVIGAHRPVTQAAPERVTDSGSSGRA